MSAASGVRSGHLHEVRPSVQVTVAWPVHEGLLFAHCGWLLQLQSTNRARFAPDLIADPDTNRVDRLFRRCRARPATA
jgi:hypothetical protein